ncbi:hypothetical protein BOX15_Mlig007370g3, partial [Macrostomum lignano]
QSKFKLEQLPKTKRRLDSANSSAEPEQQPKKKQRLDSAGSSAEPSSSTSTSPTQPLMEFSYASASVEEFRFADKRVRLLTKKVKDLLPDGRCVIYWMSRDQRVQDNWALIHAQRLALRSRLPLCVAFNLVPKFLDATIRQFDFLLRGLEHVETECRRLDIDFRLLTGQPVDNLPRMVRDLSAAALVADFSPLRVPLNWANSVAAKLPTGVPMYQVDAHNIVPVWLASDKLEYAARTIRPKIHRYLGEYLTEFPRIERHPYRLPEADRAKPVNWKAARDSLEVNMSVLPVKWAEPGPVGASRTLAEFLQRRLRLFATGRNDPNVAALSNLSPWLHFGQISAQRCAFEAKKFRPSHKESVDAFIEESVVRRELADNFCLHNSNYDSLEGAYDWARETLQRHSRDARPYLYTRQELEEGRTHDRLWNAAQLQMVREAKMHGYLRMYWAKKILEWTESPAEALSISIYLNDKYNLDGRDPNGYVGCMWSICGVHDQGWGERAVFGKIRYMNYDGCKRKFDVEKFSTLYCGAGPAAGSSRPSTSKAGDKKQQSTLLKYLSKPKNKKR